MSPKQRHYLLWSAAGAIALAGPVILLIAWALPIHVEVPPSQPIGEAPAASAAATPAAPPLDLAELVQLATRDLRRPWSDDGATTATGASTDAPLTLQLVAIASESGRSMAMIQKSDGVLAVCAVGDAVEDVGGPVTVTRIDLDRVVVSYGGATRELIMPRTPTVPEGLAP